jgi:hypothetical protein
MRYATEIKSLDFTTTSTSLSRVTLVSNWIALEGASGAESHAYVLLEG